VKCDIKQSVVGFVLSPLVMLYIPELKERNMNWSGIVSHIVVSRGNCVGSLADTSQCFRGEQDVYM
jgi:hypothetical protein